MQYFKLKKMLIVRIAPNNAKVALVQKVINAYNVLMQILFYLMDNVLMIVNMVNGMIYKTNAKSRLPHLLKKLRQKLCMF